MTEKTPTAFQTLLTPNAAEWIKRWAVGKLVNSPKNDVPACIEPADFGHRLRSMLLAVALLRGYNNVALDHSLEHEPHTEILDSLAPPSPVSNGQEIRQLF